MAPSRSSSTRMGWATFRSISPPITRSFTGAHSSAFRTSHSSTPLRSHPARLLAGRGKWLLNAQREGWEIAGVSPYWIYDGSIRVSLGVPGRLGKLFATETLAVRLQYPATFEEGIEDR